MMRHRALLFALFTAVSRVILCSAALTAGSPVDCAKHFNSIYQVNKSKKFKTTYLCYLLFLNTTDLHDMIETGVVARKSWLIIIDTKGNQVTNF